jgi:AbrB family looped-hinge helix DNA binding protein
MAKTTPKGMCCGTGDVTVSGCRVESLVSVDERGQMVLPKDLRDKADIKAGDKFAVVSWEKDGAVCCLTLIKADVMAQQVKEFLGPVLRDVMTTK